MKNKMIGRFTLSFYKGNFKDELLLKVVNFHSSERFRSNTLKNWAYEYIKEHPELIKEMEMASNEESVAITENIFSTDKSNKEVQKENLKSKVHIITKKG